MALAGSSILFTPGSGATFATHVQGGKEHNVLMRAWPNGHLIGTEQAYVFDTGPSAVLGAAGIFFDLFNADASLIVRVLSIQMRQFIEAAVTGGDVTWQATKTTAVGTGGTGLTAWLPDTGDTALDADITARLKATGGATSGAALYRWSRQNDDSSRVRAMGLMDLGWNRLRGTLWLGKGLVLRQNQGFKIEQIDGNAISSMSFTVTFMVE